MSTRFLFYLILLLAVSCIGLVRFRYLGKPFKILTGLLIVTFMSEITSRILVVEFQNSSPVYHFFIPIQFAFFVHIYAELSNWKNPDLRNDLILVMSTLSCLNLIIFQSLFRFPSNMIVISCCIMIFMALKYFFRMLEQIDEINLFRRSDFWMNVAVILFFALTLLYWGSYNYLIENRLSTKPLTTMAYYVNLVFYALLGVALCLDTNKRVL